MKEPRSILITGASSGLGRELAISYATKGVKLYLCARNEKRLDEVCDEVQSLGALVEKKIIDVSDNLKMSDWIKNIINNNDIDLVIANAGISGGTSGGCENEDQIRKIFDINLNGVLNTILPLIPYFEKRQFGQIAIVSSLSGYRGMPSCPAYSASKGAVKLFGEGIRGVLSDNNIGVTVISPGYIKTPMTDVNKFPMPFIVSGKKAAELIKRKLKNNPARIAFPWPMQFIVWFMSCLSPIITDPIYSRLPRKTSID